jgi:peptidoglycan/xylan/chitin deacetylase (PgdA/CDA1 family)
LRKYPLQRIKAIRYNISKTGNFLDPWIQTLARYIRFIFILSFLLTAWSPPTEVNAEAKKETPAAFKAPIILYHRFGPLIADGMTITTDVFESHLKYLRDKGYTVIPLRQLINFYLRKGPPPPPRSVVIAVDDGHKTVYTDMLPLVRKYRIPVTLFLYPSAISNASYAMTWDQVRALKKTGLFDMQSHTYWHPNFNKEKKRLKPAEYGKFVDMQMKKAKEKIEKELGAGVDMLAWPFGLYNDELGKKAGEAGYIAGFTIVRHHTNPSDNIMALPRYLLTNADRGIRFERLINNE